MWSFVARYADHDDAVVAWSNRTALIVAANQPFYPLYVYFFATERFEATLFTFLSTPLFMLVPAASRGFPNLSKALVPLIGTANTMLCVVLLGTGTAVELFLIPCALVATLAFGPPRRAVAMALTVMIALVWLVYGWLIGDAASSFAADELAALKSLHGYSVFGLTAILGLTYSARARM